MGLARIRAEDLSLACHGPVDGVVGFSHAEIHEVAPDVHDEGVGELFWFVRHPPKADAR